MAKSQGTKKIRSDEKDKEENVKSKTKTWTVIIYRQIKQVLDPTKMEADRISN